jgi:diaphanous 1
MFNALPQDELGLKEEKRSAMRALPLPRKQYLMKQNQEFRSTLAGSSASPSRHKQQPSYSASYGPASAAALIPRLVPQLTGDAGLMRRFSMTGWGSPQADQAEFVDAGPSDAAKGSEVPPTEPTSEEQPLQPQNTGGLWTSWWASSGGDKGATDKGHKLQTANPARTYIVAIQSSRIPDMKLVKNLISLRVHLSTAKVSFIEDFVIHEKGLQALGQLLTLMVGKSGKRKRLTEMETTVLTELIKCFRVLLNTEVRCCSLPFIPY